MTDPLSVVLTIMVGMVYPLILANRQQLSRLTSEIYELKGKVEMLIRTINGKRKHGR